MTTAATASAYTWARQKARGEEGMERLVRLLRARGRQVVDLSHIGDAQRRDIDLLIDGRHAEVKSDFYANQNAFLELTCDDKPGCLFQSRADEWYYGKLSHQAERDVGAAGIRRDIWYILPLARLQWWVAHHIDEFPLHTVTSRRGSNVWYARGIAVPLPHLVHQGLATVLYPDDEQV